MLSIREGGLDGEWKEWDGDGWMMERARDGTRNERRKGKEHGPNVPGQVFAPAKNHATIAITTTLERFCRRGTIAPVNTRTVLLLRLRLDVILWEDEGRGDVSVRGIRGRGVHSVRVESGRGERGEGRGKGRPLERNQASISIFRALSFSLFIYYHQPSSRLFQSFLIRFFLALILIRTNALSLHPTLSSLLYPICHLSNLTTIHPPHSSSPPFALSRLDSPHHSLNHFLSLVPSPPPPLCPPLSPADPDSHTSSRS